MYLEMGDRNRKEKEQNIKGEEETEGKIKENWKIKGDRLHRRQKGLFLHNAERFKGSVQRLGRARLTGGEEKEKTGGAGRERTQR